MSGNEQLTSLTLYRPARLRRGHPHGESVVYEKITSNRWGLLSAKLRVRDEKRKSILPTATNQNGTSHKLNHAGKAHTDGCTEVTESPLKDNNIIIQLTIHRYRRRLHRLGRKTLELLADRNEFTLCAGVSAVSDNVITVFFALVLRGAETDPVLGALRDL